MVNFKIDPGWLLPFVPPGTEIDLYQGKALITVLSFQYCNTYVRGYGFFGHGPCDEVDLQFYVRRKVQKDWRRGVCFIRKLVDASLFSYLRYRQYDKNVSCVEVRSQLDQNDQRRKSQHKRMHQRKKISFNMTVHEEKKELLPEGSVEAFMTGRYWVYSALKNGRTAEYQMERTDWRYWLVDKVLLKFDAERFYGSVLGQVLKGRWHSAFLVDDFFFKVISRSNIPYSPKNSILIFDGICSMCNGFVDFIITRDHNKSFDFLANQSTKARMILAVFDMEKKANATVCLVQGGKIFFESAAVLRVFKILGFPLSIFYALMIIPRCLRDMLYRWIARNRYQWFGQRSTCRFLSNQE